jgi:hypothetical protein
MTPIRVDTADDNFVLQNYLAGYIGNGKTGCAPATPNASQTHYAARAHLFNAVGDDLSNTGAFHDDIRLEANVRYAPAVVGGAERTHQLRLWPRLDAIKYVNIQGVLLSQKRRQ